VVLELQKLQDERRLDEERAWDSSEEDLDCLLEIAKQFMRYLDCMDLTDRKQFEKILKSNTQTNFFVENQYLK
jgi:hypothetical protein